MEVPSPFTPYLGTNYTATGDEARRLETFLAQPMAKLAQLKDELKRIQSQCDTVQQQYNSLSKDIDDHRALIATIRQLPIDVMQEIFICCLPHKHNAIMAQDECPILLTRICSGWRQIALNTPALWKSIHIPIPGCDSYNNRSPLSIQLYSRSDPIDKARQRGQGITQWLSRSGSSTLDITISSCNPPGPRDAYDVILDAVLQFSEQLGSLECDNPASVFLTRLASHLFPRLHTLSMFGRAHYSWLPWTYEHSEGLLLREGSEETFWRNSNILLSPNLRNIAYHTVDEDPDDFFAFPLRWEMLTSLSLNGPFVEETPNRIIRKVIIMLMACHRLEYLHLEIILRNYSMYESPFTMPTSLHASMITLPHLSELVVKSLRRLDLGTVFDLLEVPKLEICDISWNISVLSFIPDFHTRTASTLRKVNINPALFTKDEFFSFVSLCGRLVELDLTLNEEDTIRYRTSQLAICDINDKFLGELLGKHTRIEAQIYLPLLSTFRCHLRSNITVGYVLKTVKARNAYIKNMTSDIAKPLRIIDILFAFPQTIPISEELNKLQEEGVFCQFDFPYRPPTPSTDKIPFHSARQGLPHWRSPYSWGED